MMREQLLSILKANVCWLTFIKTDNSTRTLHCTLMEKYLPEKKEGGKTKEPNLEVIPVFDLDAKAWKSFRVNSFKSLRTFEEDSVTLAPVTWPSGYEWKNG